MNGHAKETVRKHRASDGRAVVATACCVRVIAIKREVNDKGVGNWPGENREQSWSAQNGAEGIADGHLVITTVVGCGVGNVVCRIGGTRYGVAIKKPLIRQRY